MIARFLSWLRGLFSPRPDTTEEQMEALRRELERMLDEDCGGRNG